MLRIYFQLGFRSLIKRKFYTTLNILGLAAGLLASAMIFLYVRNEMSFDKFHHQSEDIYRIWDETTTRQVAMIPYVWGRNVKEEFPEVKNHVNILPLSLVVKKGSEVFNENNVMVVDSTFFEIFDFPLIHGDRKHMIHGTNQLVLTPEMSEKYFGENNPMGQVLEVNLFGNIEPFEVTGVVDCPPNSHLQFDFLLPFPLVKKYAFNTASYENWKTHFIYSYLLMHKGQTIENPRERFDDFLLKHGGETVRDSYDVYVEPLESIYLESDLEFDLTPRGNGEYVRILGVVALVILVIAVINFVNLSTAQSLKRAKEVSIRKVFGSNKRSLVFQLTLEAIIISMLSMILALGLLLLLLPAFNNFTGKTFEVISVFHPGNLVLSLLIAILTGVLAGIYPAFVISSFQPVKVLHSKNVSSGRSPLARHGLVVFQFSMTAILLVATGVIYNQVSYMRSKDLGFENEQVITVFESGNISSDMAKMKRLKHELSKLDVLSVTASSSAPGQQSWSTRYIPTGWEDSEEKTISLSTIFSDYDFLRTYQIDVIRGRDFDHDIGSDSTTGFIINEAAQKLFASRDSSWLNDPIGMRLHWNWRNKPGKVIGVMKDFNFESLHRDINPLIIHVWPEYFFNIQIRIGTNGVNQALAEIESTWNRLFPEQPFDYQFVNEAYEEHLASDKQLGELFMVFSGLSILVAIMGLFGLSSFMSQEKATEISIRKVIGASETSLTIYLAIKFLKLVMIANLIAIPVGILLMNEWLNDFANRIDLPVSVFLGTTLFTVLISSITTSYHAIKTSRSNPVNVLSQN